MNLIQYATHWDSNSAERTIDSCVDAVDLDSIRCCSGAWGLGDSGGIEE